MKKPNMTEQEVAGHAHTLPIDLSRPVELVGLAVKQRSARCLILGGQSLITLRAPALHRVIPGHIVTVQPNKHWLYNGHPYLSGKIVSTRVDAPALGLRPLALRRRGHWDPDGEYWGEEGEPIEDWARSILERGTRPMFEMEQVLPGSDPENFDSDPILEAIDLANAGDTPAAQGILAGTLEADLRCLDAHAHLGNLAFQPSPRWALGHYEIGIRIGELSLADGFDGVLNYGFINNRPFLRCLHGYGLCLWRLERLEEAQRVFERLLWMNPSDNQGIRFLLPAVRAREAWMGDED